MHRALRALRLISNYLSLRNFKADRSFKPDYSSPYLLLREVAIVFLVHSNEAILELPWSLLSAKVHWRRRNWRRIVCRLLHALSQHSCWLHTYACVPYRWYTCYIRMLLANYASTALHPQWMTTRVPRVTELRSYLSPPMPPIKRNHRRNISWHSRVCACVVTYGCYLLFYRQHDGRFWGSLSPLDQPV